MNKRIYRARTIKNRRAAIIENPKVRTIKELLSYHFYIPRYQRGYRWGKQEITALLDDLLQYHLTLKQINPFYCLQPIVVRKKAWTGNNEQKIDGWEVIDGQQRLTTILIILNYLEAFVPEGMKDKLGEGHSFYTIDFETRDNCEHFFQSKTYQHEIVDTNIDFYHISMAYQYIGEWFDSAELQGFVNVRNSILDTLLDSQQNVSVIWYEYTALITSKIDNNDSSIELFRRLNEKMIPLTNTELIKALLLQSDIYPAGEKKFVKQRLFEIASQWDEMEAKLQDDKMWFFINDISYQPLSKIELLFKMLAEKWNGYENQTLVKYASEEGKPKHFYFQVFEKHLKQIRVRFSNNLSDQSHVLDPINEIWNEVKELFVTLDEWYNDYTLYHYIGFLLSINKSNRSELLKELTELKIDKDEFLNHIKNKITHEISLTKIQNEPREYDLEKGAIIKLMLLMDIEALVKQPKENTRFPFHLYKKDKTKSISHIYPEAIKKVYHSYVQLLNQHHDN